MLLLPDGRPTQKEFHIEKILGQRVSDKRYEVLWVSESAQEKGETTWEPGSKIPDAVVEEYRRYYNGGACKCTSNPHHYVI